uniref:Uncharacterized protein n=1 Tax=Caenorhabditis japonica TaxID=281687 RepID=A0A8R1ERP6_CAEJA
MPRRVLFVNLLIQTDPKPFLPFFSFPLILIRLDGDDDAAVSTNSSHLLKDRQLQLRLGTSPLLPAVPCFILYLHTCSV